MLDAARYPRLSRYLERLPRGLDSYPECQTKGAVVRQWLDHSRWADDPGLPDPVRKLIGEPPPRSSWVPETQLWSLVLATADRDSMTDEQFLKWSREFNVHLLEGPVYRVLLGMISPAMVLGLGASAFRSFHRGLDFELSKAEDGQQGQLVLRLGYPAHLLDPLCLRGLATAFEAALMLGKAHSPKIAVLEAGATETRFLASWAVR